MSPYLSGLSAQLDGLSLGQRAWFWLCPGMDGLPPLLLAPYRTDPLMRALREAVAGKRRPHGTEPLIGLCVVGEDSVMRFSAPNASRSALETLAAWVRQNAEAAPALRRLYGAQMLRVSEDFDVIEAIDAPELWEGVEPVAAPGSVAETIGHIHAMAPGEQAWFWATDAGPGGRPFLLAEPTADSTLSALNGRIEGALRRSPQIGTVVRGIIDCTPGGLLRVHTQNDARKQRIAFRALGKVYPHLRWMHKHRTIPSDDLGETAATLRSLAPKRRGWLFAGVRAREGALVLVAKDKPALAKQLRAAGLTPRAGFTGPFRVHASGTIDIASAKDAPTLMPTVARWIAQQQERTPQARALIGARLVLRGEDGAITDIITCDRAWAAL